MAKIFTSQGEQVAVFTSDGRRIWAPPAPTAPPIFIFEDASSEKLPSPDSPVPLTTYDGSNTTTHPSVVDMKLAAGVDEWNGYRWWMADTPYDVNAPAGSTIENPCIWASNDRITWVEPAPGLNPLDPDPGPTEGGYNNDTELVWDPEGQRLIAYWRKAPQELIRASTSTDGVTWSPRVDVLHPGRSGTPNLVNVSPSVIRRGPGDWLMYLFGDAQMPTLWASADPLTGWKLVGRCEMSPKPSAAWHGDFILHEGKILGVWSTRNAGNGHAAVSDASDGLSFKVSSETYASLAGYRTTLVPSLARPGYMESWSGYAPNTPMRWRLSPMSYWDDLKEGDS